MADRRHLAPLLEFILFVAKQGGRLPKRANGVQAEGYGVDWDLSFRPVDYFYCPLVSPDQLSIAKLDTENNIKKEDAPLPTEQEVFVVSEDEENTSLNSNVSTIFNEKCSETSACANLEKVENSVSRRNRSISPYVSDVLPQVVQKEAILAGQPMCSDQKMSSRKDYLSSTEVPKERKRGRPPKSATEQRRRKEIKVNSSNLPLQLEFLSKSSQKGVYEAKYVDLPLHTLGLIPLLADVEVPLERKFCKQFLGVKCCYLMLGSTMLVTGSVVDIDVKEGSMQVSPDKGLTAAVDWIEVYRLYHIPENLSAVRNEATRKIKDIMSAHQNT